MAARKNDAKEALDQRAEQACQEYVLNGGDRSKAYRKAYPQTKRWKDKTVHEKASRFFAEGKVQARVEELRAETARIAEEQFQVDAGYVLRRLVEIDQMDVADILADDGSILPVREWPQAWRRTLSGLDVSEIWDGHGDEREITGLLKKIKWPDKVKNLELIGKHVEVQAWREQHGVGNPDGGPVETVTEIRLVAADGDEDDA